MQRRPMRTGYLGRTAALALFGALLLFSAKPASSQFGPASETPETDPNAFKITTPPYLDEASRRIARLKGDLEAGDAEDREATLQSIFQVIQRELNNENNSMGVLETDEGRWTGAWTAMEAEIRSLGSEGLKAYEETYGPRAKKLLDDAVRMNNRDAVHSINRRFGLTRAGVEAAIHLARLHWEEGDTVLAARELERALSIPELLSADQEAWLSGWLAGCYRMLGERANLAQLQQRTASLHETKIRIGDGEAALGALLKNELAATEDRSNTTTESAGVFLPGGNFTNTGVAQAPAAYDEVAWDRPLPRQKAVQARAFMDYPEPQAPPFLPVFDGSMVYVNTGDSLCAWDMVSGGDAAQNPTWTCTPFPPSDWNWRTSEPDPNLALPVSVCNGVVYTAIENPMDSRLHPNQPDAQYGLHAHYPQVRRALCAVDAETGRLLWKIGGLYDGGLHDTTSFLSAFVYQDTLYAVASRMPSQAEIYLYALDPANGDVRWHLRLCYGQQETTMFGRPARQPYPSLMAIAGGKAFLCTNLGGVAAVDLSRRCLTWITRYDYMPRPVTKYTTTVYRTPSWFTSPTMYGETGGKAYVVCAPTDAGKLFALDASTGRVAWELRSDGSPISWGRSLVGIRDGKVYVAALYDLYAFDLATGREVQHLRVRQSSAGGGVCQLAGRPVIAEDRILWPGYMGRAGGITEIDTETLAVRRTVSLPGSWSGFGFSVFSQGGLLFTVGGNDYSAGNCRVSARYSVRGLLEKIREELARNPEDAALTLRMALITLRTGDAKAGIEALKKAFDLAEQPPVSQSVRDAAARSLVAAWLQEADREIAAGRTASALELVESARVYALTRGQRSDCFSREEIAVSRSGDAAAKAAMYRRLVDDDPDFGVGADPEIPARTYGIVRLAQLLSDRDHAGEAMGLYQELLDAPVRYAVEGISLREIALAGQRDLIKRFGRETYRSLEEEAVLLVKSGKEEDLEKALRCYPLSRAADDALLALARMQLDAHRADEVVAMLQQALEEESDRPRLAELNCLLALAHHAAGERLRARLAALRVLRTWPEGSLSVNGERVPFKDLLEPLTKQQATAEESAAKPRLPGRLGLLWSSPWGAAGFVRIPDQPAPGAEPRLYVGSASRETGNRLAALDPATGQEAWSWQGLVTPTSVHRAPKGLLFVLAQGLMLFSEQGEQLWEVTTFGVPAPVDVRDDMVIYTTRYQDSRTRRQMSRVTALDAASGVNVWESDLEAGSVLWLRQTEFGVVALTSGREIELVLLDLETGKQLKSCPVSNLTSTRRNVPPLVEEGLVHLVDTRGAIQTYDLLTLDAVASLDTRIADPSLWQRTEHGLLVVGATSVAMFDLAEGKAHWTHSLAKGEAIVERLTCGDSLMLATIQADQTQMIEALRLSDGVSRFRSSCAEEDAARLKLKAGAGFDGGAVFIFTDHRKEDERLELWGFHMLVIDNDGAKRYVWEHESEGASVYVQLQAVDGHVVATCDGTTFCFGRKD